MKYFSAILLCLLTAFLICCSTSSKKDNILEVKFQQALVIGEERVPDPDDKNIFKFIIDVAVDKEGGIYVADPNLSAVRKFDKNGKFLWELNQTGEGPGEFLRTVDIYAAKNGEIYFADQKNQKIIIYAQDGKHMDEFRTRKGELLKIAVDLRG